MNITLIVALITAISAIIAPVITAIINTRHELKLKTLDLFFHSKLEAYSQFIKVSSCFPSNPSEVEMRQLLNASAYASLLSSDDTRSKISVYSSYIINNVPEQIEFAYAEAILAMQNELYDFRNYYKKNNNSQTLS